MRRQFTAGLLRRQSKNSSAQSIPSLKEVFKNDFAIGTALNTEQIEEKDPRAATLVSQQFNMATPENIMKAEIIHPQWGSTILTLLTK